ncbi:MAG TPA: hypothetical protein VJY65_13660, partial [Chloroflexota bacterium]|nr:hypothetical protein [Chloroflexota bacterium]
MSASQPHPTSAPELFRSELRVVSAGLGDFAAALRDQSVSVIELDWRPPAGGRVALVDILTASYADAALSERIERANQEVLRRIVDANPQIVDVAPA